MKCYEHPTRDAIAVCLICKRGICKDCAVTIGGKFYCKEDADKAFRYISQSSYDVVLRSGRSGSIAVASVLFFIFGILTVLGSLFMIIASGFVVSIPFLGFIGGGLLIFGFISLFIGILDIAAGYWLWNSLKKGGVLGIILAVLGILTSIPFLAMPAMAVITIISIIIDIMVIVLIAIGWDSLR